MKKILLVEDELNLAHSIQLNLEIEGYEVVHADTGTKAIEMYTHQGPFHLVILDVMLPGKNGFEVASAIRAADGATGILMLTALANDESRIKGLSTGVDDYLTKPFNLVELMLRVKRMLDRADMMNGKDVPEEKAFEFSGYHVDPNRLVMTGPRGEFQLTKLEVEIMREFLNSRGVTLTREHLLKTVWGISSKVETRTIDNFVMRIRKMIEVEPENPTCLLSVRGVGYRFEK